MQGAAGGAGWERVLRRRAEQAVPTAGPTGHEGPPAANVLPRTAQGPGQTKPAARDAAEGGWS